MRARLRIVFDTNVWISAALFKQSVPRQAFDKAFYKGDMLLSVEVLTELNEVLSRRSFAKYVTEEERLAFLSVLVREAKLVETTEHLNECRDPDDDKFLELAVSGNAHCIVSGDQDLLVMNPFRGIPIITPRNFLDDAW